MPITGGGTFGNYASTPIVLDGVVFTQDLTSNVQGDRPRERRGAVGEEVRLAVHGPERRRRRRRPRVRRDPGQRLRARRLERRRAVEGQADPEHEGRHRHGAGRERRPRLRLHRPGQPDGFYTGNGQGILHALNAETGEKVWQFDTVPEDLWGNKEINSGGGLWHPPAFDDEGSDVLRRRQPGAVPRHQGVPVGLEPPGQQRAHELDHQGRRGDGRGDLDEPGPPHDIYDWDLHLPPVLADTADGQQIVAQPPARWATSTRSTARAASSLWKTAVGKHNGHDNDNELALAGKIGPAAEAAADAAARHPRRRRDADGGRQRRRLRARSSTCRRLFKAQDDYTLQLDEGHRRHGGARPRHRRGQVEARLRTARVRRRDRRQRPGLHDHVRRQDRGPLDRDAATRCGASRCPPAPTPRSRWPATT